MSTASISLDERSRLVRRAQLLAWGGNGWHLVEFAIALGAGLAAGSIALVAFGIDSLIELAAGSVIIWRLAARRVDSETAERRAQQLIAATYALLAAYVAVEATQTLIQQTHPRASWVGIGLAAFTALTMPLLAIAKRRVGHALGSSATASEGTQNMICAYLSVALLIGLGTNALFGWWWADPLAALVIGVVAAREGVLSWRGEACSCCAPIAIEQPLETVEACTDACCQPATPPLLTIGRAGRVSADGPSSVRSVSTTALAPWPPARTRCSHSSGSVRQSRPYAG